MVLGNPPRQEYSEYSSILVNCSASVSGNLPVRWEICLDGIQKVLCARAPGNPSCEGSISTDFYGRVYTVDATTIRVINMTIEDSGVVSCYRGFDQQRIYLFTAEIIGYHILFEILFKYFNNVLCTCTLISVFTLFRYNPGMLLTSTISSNS